MTSALTTIETGQLAAYERTIESGLQTFVEVGAALSAIRDSKLYRARYGTFEEYCRERWGMSRPRAYQLIESASTVSTIVDKGQPPPATESQARPLAKLPPAEQPEAWQEAVTEAADEGRKVTAKDVERAVERRSSAIFNPISNEAKGTRKTKQTGKQKEKSRPIPAALQGAINTVRAEMEVCAANNWERCDRKDLVRQLCSLVKTAKG